MDLRRSQSKVVQVGGPTPLTRRRVLGQAAALGVGLSAASWGNAGTFLAGVGQPFFAVSAAPLAQEPSWQAEQWTVGFPSGVEMLAVNRLEGGVPSSEAYETFFHLYDTLVAQIALRYGPAFTAVPRLAESWELLDDVTWEFKLRQGVTFHNGDPFSAEDVKYMFDDALQPNSSAVGLQSRVEGVEIIDPYTIRVTTKGPQAAFLSTLSDFFIFPKKYREEVGREEFGKRPIGSGPYKFVEWTPGERVVLDINTDYWDSPVNGPLRLVIRGIPDAATRVAELQTGGVDIIAAPPFGQLEQIDAAEESELVVLKGSEPILYFFNTTKPPFDDARVRQAVNLAINREAILNDLLGGQGELLHGPYSAAFRGYDPDLVPYAYDPDKARQLLAESGHPDGFNTEMHFATGGRVIRGQEIAEAVAAQLAEIGINVELFPTDVVALEEAIYAGTVDGISQSTWGTSDDPKIMLDVVFLYTAVLAPDEKLAEMIAGSDLALDQEERNELLKEIGQHVHEQAPWLFIHAQDAFWAKRTGIPWEPYPVGGSFSWALFYRPN